MSFDAQFDEILTKKNLFEEFVREYRNSDKKIFLFGAGFVGNTYLTLLKRRGVKVEGVIDNYKTVSNEQKLLKFDDVLGNYDPSDCVFIISTMKYCEEIKAQLMEFVESSRIFIFAITTYSLPENVPERIKTFYSEHKERIRKAYDSFSDDYSRKVLLSLIEGRITADHKNFDEVRTDNAYYSPELIDFGKDEVMAELGANNGATLLSFIEHCPDFKKVYCFEPDKNCIAQLEKIAQQFPDRIRIIQKAAWEKSTVLRFDAHGGDGSSAVSDSGLMLEAASVDEEITENITYMKMDIEGSEMMALRGAREQIIRNKPKLVICVYHKPGDIFEIPDYLRSLRHDYKIYMRHEGYDDTDTVIYAI